MVRTKYDSLREVLKTHLAYRKNNPADIDRQVRELMFIFNDYASEYTPPTPKNEEDLMQAFNGG